MQATSTLDSRQPLRRSNRTCPILPFRAAARLSLLRPTAINCRTRRNGPPTLGLSYLIPTSTGDWTLDAQYLHNSGWFGEADNQLRQPAYDNVNAALHWHVNNGPYTIGLWCRNLTNCARVHSRGG